MTDRVRTTPTWGAASAPGPRHEHNEDAIAVGPDWFVVADGMGGHAAGDVASEVAAGTIANHPAPLGDDHAGLVAGVHAVVDDANRAVRRRAVQLGAPDMGCTVVAARTAVADGAPVVVVAHVGDARCYRLAEGELRLVTRDHSHVQELIDAGRLTTEQAASHPLRSVVTRALGIEPEVRPDIAVFDDRPSRWLLCTDGLTSSLRPAEIGRTLAASADPQVAADRLVSLAIEGGARDDVTALVVDLAPTAGRPSDTPRLELGARR